MINLAIKIENATSRDIEKIYNIELLCYKLPWPKEMLVLDYMFNGKSAYYVAKWMRNIVGFIGFWNEGEKLHIVNIAVHPDYRKRGIGTKLIDFAIKITKKSHKREVYLEVRKTNTVAQKLYKKFGFHITERKENYYTDGEEGFIMRKTIDGYTGN